MCTRIGIGNARRPTDLGEHNSICKSVEPSEVNTVYSAIERPTESGERQSRQKLEDEQLEAADVFRNVLAETVAALQERITHWSDEKTSSTQQIQ